MRYLTILLTVIFITNLNAEQDIPLNISTGELPPYSYTKNNQLTGLAVDIVKELQKRVNHTAKIRKKPWGRAISESQNANQLTFPVARLPYREKSYKWIGPILNDETIFVSKKSQINKKNNIDDFKHLRIGVSLGAPTTKRLQQLNFENLLIIPTETQLSKMFIRDRFDLWYSSKLMIYSFLNKLNYDTSELEVIYRDMKFSFYITVSLDIDDKTIQTWQNELDKMKKDGTYKSILKRYEIK